LPFFTFAYEIFTPFFPVGGQIKGVIYCCNGIFLRIERYYRDFPLWGNPASTMKETNTYFLNYFLMFFGLSKKYAGVLSSGNLEIGSAYFVSDPITRTCFFPIISIIPCIKTVTADYLLFEIGSSFLPGQIRKPGTGK
jgi:hypothetical protein